MSSETTALLLAERLGNVLLTARRTLVIAESCTGGGIAWLVTSVPGSSQWFERGIVAYSNAAKQELLGVGHDLLAGYGAVSEQTAAAMAQGALRNSHADLSVAVTGIAGPDGGTETKPVGTVCFAWSRRNGATRTARTWFNGDRRQVREQAVLMAMQGLLDMLEPQ
jgi:nicotinamide-nucleotide amidase